MVSLTEVPDMAGAIQFKHSLLLYRPAVETTFDI